MTIDITAKVISMLLKSALLSPYGLHWLSVPMSEEPHLICNRSSETRCCPGRRLFRCRLFPALAVALVGAGAVVAQANKDFQIDLTLGGKAPVPRSGAEAASSIPLRRQAIIANLACGQELDFLSRVRSIAGANKAKTSDEDAVNLSLAKMYWILGLPDANFHPQLLRSVGANNSLDDGSCRQSEWIQSVPKADDVAPPFDHKNREDYGRDFIDASRLNDAFARTFGEVCSGVVAKVEADGQLITYNISRACLISEFNLALSEVFVTGQMGSAGSIGCKVFSSLPDAKANWDFTMRALIRVVYIDQLATAHDFSLLRRDVRDHILHDLINTRIYLGPSSYPIDGCFNTENQTGDAASRVDEGGFFSDLGNDLGSFLAWLVKHWYLAVPWLDAASEVPELLPFINAAAAADVAVQNIVIPETENHRLMIESTRYLNNQLLKYELTGDEGRLKTLASAQGDVHDWLLKRLQSILLTDFIEYNARSYQREAIGAIMNLYDFAQDPEMVSAAHLVLEYAAAKFAIGSNQGRRLVPFRRHMSDLHDHIEDGESVLVTASGADHQEGLGLLYLGQTQQLESGFAPSVLPAEVAFGAFSWYQPNKLVLDLGIDKSIPYLQRFRHDGLEAYSSGKGFLITAGGVINDYAYTIVGLGDAQDKGAAVPTTLMLSGNKDKVTMWDLLSFHGIRYSVHGSAPGTDPRISYDHNNCMDRGFACGLNSWVPNDIKACLQKGPPNREPFWFFFDSTSCGAYSSGPPVYIVLYLRPCLDATDNCSDFGFFEAVDVTEPATPATFAAFKTGVLARNPRANLIATPPSRRPADLANPGRKLPAVPLKSTYFASDGRKIEFDPTAHILDSDKTGITAVNGQPAKKWKDWGTADGDLVDKNDWPLVRIKNPRFPGLAVTLDFRGWGVAHYDGP